MEKQVHDLKQNNLVITGLSLDKRDSARIHRLMAKDPDIERILNPWSLLRVTLMNHPVWKWIIYVIGAILVYLLTQTATELLTAWIAKTPVDVKGNIFNVWSLIITCISILFTVRKNIASRIHLKVPKTTWKNYVRFIRLFNRPLDIWNLFVSNISDAQAAIPFFKEAGATAEEDKPAGSTSMYFTGIPYYDVKFIDSIYIDFRYEKKGDDPNISRALRRLEKIARKLKERLITELQIHYLNHYAEESGISTKDIKAKEEYKRDPHNLFSGFVFGIRFLSKFLYKITENDRSHLFRAANGQRIPVALSIMDDSLLGLTEGQKEALYEAIDLSTNHLFYWDDGKANTANQIRLKVGMTEMGTQSLDYGHFRRKRFERNKAYPDQYVPTRYAIRIPFKRPIAVPKRRGSGKAGLAAALPYQAERMLHKTNVLFVGGAEHNLAFLCALREYRKEHATADVNERMGILENEYDYQYHNPANLEECPILISAEKLVQSFYIRGKDADAGKFNFNYIGEAVRFTLQGSNHFYTFFGYSAPMTKIISAFLAKDFQYYHSQLFKAREYDRYLDMERMILLLYNDSEQSPKDQKLLEQENDFEKREDIQKKYRSIYRFPALDIWDRNDFINVGDSLKSPERVSIENWKKLMFRTEKIVLINSSCSWELDKLEEAVEKSPFGHNDLYGNPNGRNKNSWSGGTNGQGQVACQKDEDLQIG